MSKNSFIFLLLLPLVSACSYMPSWMGGREETKPKLAGERFVALPVENGLKADAEASKTPQNLPPVTKNTDWAQGAGSFPTAANNLDGGNFSKKISAEIGEGKKFENPLVPQPVVSGGKVFAMDGKGNISAHHASDIAKVIWKSSAATDEEGNDIIGGGLAASGDTLYATTGSGVVAAIESATGKQIWRKNLSMQFRSSPRVSGDVIVVVAIDSHSYGLSTKNGDIIWDHRGIDEAAEIMNIVSPTISGSVVVVPYSSGELFALSLADGREIWSDALIKSKSTEAYGIFSGIGGDPVVDSGAVFATSNGGVTVAIAPNGGRIWQQQAPSLNSPWLAGDELFVLTSDNTLVDMVKYTGKIRWVVKLPSYEDQEKKREPIVWRGPVLLNGKLLVTSASGKAMFVAAKDGKIVSDFEIPEGISTPPVVAERKLFLADKKANLYVFE